MMFFTDFVKVVRVVCFYFFYQSGFALYRLKLEIKWKGASCCFYEALQTFFEKCAFKRSHFKRSDSLIFVLIKMSYFLLLCLFCVQLFYFLYLILGLDRK